MKFLNLFLIIIFLASCNSKKQSQREEVIVQNDSVLIKKEDLSEIKIRDIALDVKAKAIIESWQPYLNISEAISGLKNAEFTFFNTDGDMFTSSITDFEQTIPKDINTEAVQARVLALKTMLYKLEDTLTLPTTTKDNRLTVIKEVFTAFSNLNLQINKKLEKDSQTILKPY